MFLTNWLFIINLFKLLKFSLVSFILHPLWYNLHQAQWLLPSFLTRISAAWRNVKMVKEISPLSGFETCNLSYAVRWRHLLPKMQYDYKVINYKITKNIVVLDMLCHYLYVIIIKLSAVGNKVQKLWFWSVYLEFSIWMM